MPFEKVGVEKIPKSQAYLSGIAEGRKMLAQEEWARERPREKQREQLNAQHREFLQQREEERRENRNRRDSLEVTPWQSVAAGANAWRLKPHRTNPLTPGWKDAYTFAEDFESFEPQKISVGGSYVKNASEPMNLAWRLLKMQRNGAMNNAV